MGKEKNKEKRTPRQRARSAIYGLFAGVAKILLHRAVLVSVSILIQLAIFALLVWKFLQYFALFYLVNVLIAVAAVLKIIGSRYQSAYKISWAVLVLSLPVFGGLLYLFYGGNKLSRREKKALQVMQDNSRRYLGSSDDQTKAYLREEGKAASRQARFIENLSGCPPYLNQDVQYYPLGDVMFPDMLEELEHAEQYIFLEYFIIREGVMWNQILEVLKRKAEQGVDVRVMYDDIGCLYSLPKNYDQKLKKMGIRCEVFNRYRPVVSLRMNNRDHRKILVVDGRTAFTGGINLSDEYINRWERFGHWKDTGVRVRGAAVRSFTAMFLSAWNSLTGEQDDIEKFIPETEKNVFEPDGVVLPYDDSPLDGKPVAASIYHNLISKATDYIYITTPYLIIDDDMVNTLCAAARSGVDVRIITPHIPDKKIAFELTRAHYGLLLEAGVRIFEYTPGFIHAKNFVVDGKFATVGTVNMDYRSLYLHFECGVWMCGCSAISAVRDDFLATQEQSQEISLEDAKQFTSTRRLYHAMLRAFAPLF